MRYTNLDPDSPPRGRAALRCQRGVARLATLLVTLGAVLCMGATLTTAGAQANSYRALLTSNINWGTAGFVSGPPGTVFNQNSWTAPASESYGAFAVTSANFYSDSTNTVGGISAGIGGDGSANTPTYFFPWFQDCSITNNGHYWTFPMNWGSDIVAGTNSGTSSCSNNADNGGWNYTNSEINETNVGLGNGLGQNYTTLWLSAFCQASSCSNEDAGYDVSNLSAIVGDPQDSPANSLLYLSGKYSGTWYQTNSGNVSLAFNAIDPSGVCSLDAQLTGPQTVDSGDLVGAPALTNPGGVIGTEYTTGTSAPCNTAENYGWTVPSGIASGVYGASVQAANAGQYADSGYTDGASTIASNSNLLYVDNTQPTASWENTSSAWSATTSERLDVTVGPSGVGSVSCTDNGSAVSPTLVSGSTTGAGTTVWSVPTPQGTDSLSCRVSNADANGSLTSNPANQTYSVDTTVPAIAYSDPGYTAGTWTAAPQTITVTASGGPSGVSSLSCTIDGNALPDSFGDTEVVGAPAGVSQIAHVSIPADGAHTLDCSADNAGTPSINGTGTYQVSVDSQVPVTTFMTGSGYAATSTQAADPQTASGQNWLNAASSTITVGVTGTEATVESGVASTTCTINGYTTEQEVLSNTPASGTIAQSTPFLATFTADPKYGWIDGQNVISCKSQSVAGLIGADGTTAATTTVEYVDVNDASWPTQPGKFSTPPTAGQCAISSVINNGGCAYSNGPSQTAWYSTAQNVTITADDTGAAAPITSITCSGAPMVKSSWTAAGDPGAVDSHNGLTVTGTITAPGGKIDCVAADSANPADTWELGSYNVSIDPSAPTGYFAAQGAGGAAKNIIQLDLAANPSGIKQVTVQAVDESTGQTYTGQQLTTNPADGVVAYATLDQNTGTWNLTVNPAIFPGINDKIRFQATATTNAGVSAQITTAEDGSTEVLTPGGLGATTPVPGTGYSQSGDATVITATARAGRWHAAGTVQSQLPTALQGSSSNPVAPTPVATIASWKHAMCKSPHKHKHRKAGAKPAATHTTPHHRRSKPKKHRAPKRSCRALVTHAPRADGLPAKYRQTTEITGTLWDTTTNAPIAGAQVAVYTTNLATDQVRLMRVETTGARGNFAYRLPAGPNRRVDLIYIGRWTSTHGADTAFTTTTAGLLKIHGPKIVKVGKHMRIVGHLYGGAIDAKGALVQTAFRIVGTKEGWIPYSSGRSSTRGRFVIRYPITRNDRGGTYRVRVKVSTQAGWGYRGTTSNVLTFHVR